MWLYGSRARGPHHLESDIDLVVSIRGDERESPYTVWFFRGELWQQELSSALGHRVHLKHFNEDEPEAARPDWIASFMRDRVLIYDLAASWKNMCEGRTEFAERVK